MTITKLPPRNGKARSSSGRLVRLSASDWRELKASASRKGYATVRFNPRTGHMLAYQWKSWLKLTSHGLPWGLSVSPTAAGSRVSALLKNYIPITKTGTAK